MTGLLPNMVTSFGVLRLLSTGRQQYRTNWLPAFFVLRAIYSNQIDYSCPGTIFNHEQNNSNKDSDYFQTLSFIIVTKTTSKKTHYHCLRHYYGAIIFTGMGAVCLWVGGPEFLRVVKGGASFFSVVQTGDQNFLRVKKGWTKFFSLFFFCTFGAMFFHLCSWGQKEGPEFVSVGKGGTRIFYVCKGGTRKNWRPAITNRRPLGMAYRLFVADIQYFAFADIRYPIF